jgi:hypothetical protein
MMRFTPFPRNRNGIPHFTLFMQFQRARKRLLHRFIQRPQLATSGERFPNEFRAEFQYILSRMRLGDARAAPPPAYAPFAGPKLAQTKPAPAKSFCSHVGMQRMLAVHDAKGAALSNRTAAPHRPPQQRALHSGLETKNFSASR